MILDYNYNKSKRNLSISYVTDEGGKALLNFNVSRFKSYYSTPSGQYKNWDGAACDIKWVDKPTSFDIKTYLMELPDKYKALLKGKVAPKLYTFDIEVEISDEFPEPEQAKFPITTISIASPDCNVIVLGTKALEEGGDKKLQNDFDLYLGQSKYFNGLNISKPYIKYIKFDSEEQMLKYFLTTIVAKVPVLAGWNSILFDWHYIQNRIRNYYPGLSLACSSYDETMSSKNYTDLKGDKVRLNIPNHTLILDMMDVVGNFDMVVMPIKESLSLDYIAQESIGMNKIKYDGDLQKLYEEDYSKYVFYNAIDSILVQLIDKRFKTLQNIYTQSLYCGEKIGSCFSKIALTEALFFNYFYENGIKVVPIDNYSNERGTLIGAYVRTPTPGKHNFVCCNDFASLYPSSIISCNMSIENFVGVYWDEKTLIEYKKDPMYVVVGPNVYRNKGTAAKPVMGEHVGKFLDDETLDKYRGNKDYFVSVNGSLYHNDKPYAFKVIQATLKDNRNTGKYLAKQLEALVISDIDHMLQGHTVKHQEYPKNLIDCMEGLGHVVKSTLDLMMMDERMLKEFRAKVKKEIEYNTSFEQAMKLLGNSMYGGSSHVAFAWFNMYLANDITGEARNIIHKMEDHIPTFMEENWKNMTDFHKKHGIYVKPDAKDFLNICYGDTDSLYISYQGLLNSIDGIEKMSTEKKLSIIVDLNTGFLDQHNREYMKDYYASRHVESVQNFELETVALSGCWLDVKKRYAQILLWKDGKTFDMDKLPMKIKGLEMIKSSVPKQAREGLKRLIRYLLEDSGEGYLLQRLNIEMIKEREMFYNADLEDICGNVGVQGYTKYILDDNNTTGLVVAPKCPYNVRALGNYNWIRNRYKLEGDPLYGGKMKWYIYQPIGSIGQKHLTYFAFQSKNYPKWGETYAPVCKSEMFQQFMLDPFNRVLSAIGIGELRLDGSIQMSLF
jgi:DNA polymerase elongation subunit (family B)